MRADATVGGDASEPGDPGPEKTPGPAPDAPPAAGPGPLAAAAVAAAISWLLVVAAAPALRLAGWAAGSVGVMSLATAAALAGGHRRRPWLRLARPWYPVIMAGVVAAAIHAFAFATAVSS